MADGRHLEKLKTAISPQRFDQAAQNLALALLPTSALKSGATPYRLIPKCLIWNDTK